MKNFSYEPWPVLPYTEFKATSHLLHMAVQAIGKLKLKMPFEPHWANVALWLNSQGLTTGLIPYRRGAFSIELDLISHQIICRATWGMTDQFDLMSMSVAQFVERLFAMLNTLQIDMQINLMPQEIPQPIPFDQDTALRNYDKILANAWWRILVSSYLIMKQYHAKFNGESPPIGLMWGTFDLRDARYNGIRVPTIGENSGYIRRNAMDEAQVEIGWWPGNETYPRPAYYSFTYPQPKNIEQAKIKPKHARWEKTLREFILDYDDLLNEAEPAKVLLEFFESTYEVGAKLANWKSNLITNGEPV